ncbi:AbrB/MazE/SpoVT family DNA-binding domain-containing protein [Granulicella sibirica]|uniref:Prevent host death protein, Phd antitoxin n=1 Tax=Granulicella sibirica TaxID=2479048 RepID=A0A4V1L5U1_9BACT|nr:AbrB/MazE/SpoVT family DNA-binding domain-containing protein [Granulicella sibirica]RXH56944.1 hypothetical protein GRAN_0254 [Granulicella sibirica]
MAALKLEAFGTCTGIAIPEEMLVQTGVGRGDTLFVVETPNGYLLSPRNPETDHQVELGGAFMKKYQETLKRLAQ